MKLLMNAGLLTALILSYFSCNSSPAPSPAPDANTKKIYTLKWNYDCNVIPAYFDYGIVNGNTLTSIGHKQFSVCNGNTQIVTGFAPSANLQFYIRACISTNQCGPAAEAKPQ